MADSASWFMSGLPGRWRVLPDRENDPWASRFPAQDHRSCQRIRPELGGEGPGGATGRAYELVAYCGECDHLLAEVGRHHWHAERVDTAWVWHGPFSNWREMLGDLGDHRHDDEVQDGLVRYYLEHGVGPWKTEMLGTWEDVILAVPYLIQRGLPIPPLSVINEVLGGGGSNAGMSGGVESPPHELSAVEYASLSPKLARAVGSIDVAVPEDVSHAEYMAWVFENAPRFRQARDLES